MNTGRIEIYTDGSCNSKHRIGGWAAIILYSGEKQILEGHDENTTHQRMELIAVIKALEYVSIKLSALPITLYTDSQYVKDLAIRKEKLQNNNFITKKKTDLPNTDLIKAIFTYSEQLNITFVKVKAHEKTSGSENYNHEVDRLARKIVRARCSMKVKADGSRFPQE